MRGDEFKVVRRRGFNEALPMSVQKGDCRPNNYPTAELTGGLLYECAHVGKFATSPDKVAGNTIQKLICRAKHSVELQAAKSLRPSGIKRGSLLLAVTPEVAQSVKADMLHTERVRLVISSFEHSVLLARL